MQPMFKIDLTKDEKLSREFYKNTKPVLPPFPQTRQFRVRLWDGTWVKIKDRIKTPEQLQQHLIRLGPRDVYFSTARWLNPTVVGPKKLRDAGYKVADNLFLGSELYFDLDDATLEDVILLKQYLKNKYNFTRFVMIKTGRGYHLWVLDFEDIMNIAKKSMPREREIHYTVVKSHIVKDLLAHNFKFDTPITLDSRRIVRVPNTLHGGTFTTIKIIEGLKWIPK